MPDFISPSIPPFLFYSSTVPLHSTPSGYIGINVSPSYPLDVSGPDSLYTSPPGPSGAPPTPATTLRVQGGPAAAYGAIPYGFMVEPMVAGDTMFSVGGEVFVSPFTVKAWGGTALHERWNSSGFTWYADTGLSFGATYTPTQRMQLSLTGLSVLGNATLTSDTNALTLKDTAANNRWLAGLRSDVTGNANDYVLYGYTANASIRVYDSGTEIAKINKTGIYATAAVYFGENTGAWGYRGFNLQTDGVNKWVQIINSQGANPAPYIDFAPGDQPYPNYAVRINVAQRSVAFGKAITMANAQENVLGLSDIPAALGGNPANGGYLYANAGKLFWRGSAGTVTQLAVA